jgi:hypothetical protein
LRIARRLKLAGAATASLFSAGVLPALGWGQTIIAGVTAVVSFFGSILALVGESFEKPLVGGQESTADILAGLLKLERSAQTLHLQAVQELFDGKVETGRFAQEVNSIATELRRLEVFGDVGGIR